MNAGKYYLNTLLKSNGMEALDRFHKRSFTLNILEVNLAELDDVITKLEDSKLMVAAFAPENSGASTQLHREANRLVHNYLCAVSTYIDHSRNFMKRYYSDTVFLVEYEKEVKKRFIDSGHARFVRDLRNYITHRGLPNSNMSLNMKPAGEPNADGSIPAEITSGVSYEVAEFLKWDKWTSQAKKYLKNLDKEVSLRSIFEPHFALMNSFNDWYKERYFHYHLDDMNELKDMERVYEGLQGS